MVQRRKRDRSLFEALLPDGHKLWPDWLRRINTLLEDEAVIEVVAQALEMRWPQSRLSSPGVTCSRRLSEHMAVPTHPVVHSILRKGIDAGTGSSNGRRRDNGRQLVFRDH